MKSFLSGTGTTFSLLDAYFNILVLILPPRLIMSFNDLSWSWFCLIEGIFWCWFCPIDGQFLCWVCTKECLFVCWVCPIDGQFWCRFPIGRWSILMQISPCRWPILMLISPDRWPGRREGDVVEITVTLLRQDARQSKLTFKKDGCR